MDATITPTTCAAHPDRPTEIKCTQCQKPLCEDCRVTLADNTYCADCTERAKAQVRESLAHMTSRPNYLGALILGLVVAVIGGVIWERVGTWFNLHLGIIAIVIGIGVGKAVIIGAGGKHGRGLQILSLLLTALGILLGLAFSVHSYLLSPESKIDPNQPLWLLSFMSLPIVLKEMSIMFWVILGIGLWEGWKIPAAPQVDL